MDKTKLLLSASILLLVSVQVDAALISRLGGLAYYDDVADLTWLADANAGAGSTYDDGISNADGLISWSNANDWAASLTIDGVSGWRLPDTIDVGNDGRTYTNVYEGVDYGYNITTHSEMSNMFYNVLGNTAIFDTAGTFQSIFGLTNIGPFSNLQSNFYWSATEYAPDADDAAWGFRMSSGVQARNPKELGYSTWAVQSGDVSAVPTPSALLLFLTGILGLGITRFRCR